MRYGSASCYSVLTFRDQNGRTSSMGLPFTISATLYDSRTGTSGQALRESPASPLFTIPSLFPVLKSNESLTAKTKILRVVQTIVQNNFPISLVFRDSCKKEMVKY